MRKLLKYLKNFKLECAIAPSFKMLEALFELFVPLVMTKIIDLGITGHDKSIVYQNGAVLILLGLIGLTCSLIAQYFAARAAIGFATGVRKDLFDRILSFSHENIDNLGSSSLITRMTNDINTTQNGVNMVLRLLLRSPFIVFGAMIMAFTINVKSAITFTLVIPALFLVVCFITIYTIPKYKAIQKQLDRLTLHIRENLSGARVMRAFEACDNEETEFDKDNDKFYEMNMFTSRISALLNPATLILVNLALLIVIKNGGTLVNDGILTNGQVVALINYMSQILVELVKLTNLFVTINKATASGARIAETMEVLPAVKDEGTLDAGKFTDVQDIFSLEDVSFAYFKGGNNSLENISFTIKKGETIGIIGGTGSGKSTLVSMLTRFYDATEGSIKLSGNELKDYSLSSLRKRIALVPQKAQLFTGTVRDNLKLGNNEAGDDRLWKALEISEAGEIIKNKEGGLDYVISEAGSNLSGGQKQRLTIARALATDADILILDDSSSALDYATDARLRANLKNLNDNLTVLIVSQRVISVQNADRIIVMDDGKLAGFGTHDELLGSCPEYAEIVASQTGKEAV